MSSGHLEILSQLRVRALNRADSQEEIMHEAVILMGVSSGLSRIYAELSQWSSAIGRMLGVLEQRMRVMADNMSTLHKEERSDIWVEEWVFEHMG
ncbi:uncharacterized protein N7500_010083 [Penicillium coprophilum]|uniref:uncharacterized protein n=1 Tax=Penicillium coprophilum TaxID=36646 RepID=UPI0023928C14|nr:uncharacterized protein N7500_010083 [Penicillium coprophilum]KAJ5154644.1 hypothetical protein N7500_010083 [Penicillium coprophilum]